MVKENKRKQLHYKKAEFIQPSPRSLQELVEEALAKLKLVNERYQQLNDELHKHLDVRQFINLHTASLGMYFGNLVLFEQGKNVHTIEMEDEVETLPVAMLAPPTTEEGVRREFLDSILYFGLKDNHVILLQSKSLRSRDIEKYLNWLLYEAEVLDRSNGVLLNNTVPAPTKKKVESAPVKKVKLGTPLFDSLEEEPSVAVKTKTKRVSFYPKGKGMEILRLVADGRLLDFSFDHMEDESNIEVFVEVTYKNKTDEQSQKAMNQITSALRHAEQDDLRVELKDAGVLTGDDLQIKSFQSLITHNGLVDPGDVFQTMHRWLRELMERSLIELE